MRRLPIYFLVDVATPIDVNTILKNTLLDMCSDPYLLESAYVSIITYADDVKITLPFTALEKIKTLPQLENSVGRGVSFGDALICLMDDIDKRVVKTTAEVKGDWAPLVFLFTNAISLDLRTEAYSRWNQGYKYKTFSICIDEDIEQQTNSHLFNMGISIRNANKIAEIIKRYPYCFYAGMSLEEFKSLVEK